jgi:undecaprenyl-diphosphatase
MRRGDESMTELILRLSQHDEQALRALLLRRRWWADHLMRAVTHLGGATVSIAAALFLLATFPLDTPLGHAGVVGAFALALSHALVQLVKRSVDRPRPRMPVGLESLVRAPDRFSFPSGHAAASLSVALPVALAVGGTVGWAILFLGLVVGFSRSYLGVHYPGDVLVGWLLAILGVWAAVLVGL